MMRVLVTGSSGFIGGAICAVLVQRCYSVRAFHRASSNLTLLNGLPVEHAIGDITQPESLQAAMQGVDIVFHTAALLGNSTNGADYAAITTRGTRNVLEAALAQGVQRLVHTSTLAALGLPSSPAEMLPPAEAPILSENSTWNIRPDLWHYGYSKYRAELEVQKAVADGLDAVIVNPSFVVGPGDIYRIHTSPIVQLATKNIPFIPAGGFNLVHIDDVVNGHLAALEYGKRGERYILGGENLTFQTLFSIISELSLRPMPKLILPGKLLRSLAILLQPLQALFSLPVPMELLRFAGYGFYITNQKSIQDLKLKYQYSAKEALQSGYLWFKEMNAGLH